MLQLILNTLPRSFYLRDTVAVAKSLLGKRLVRRIGRSKISGVIIETEAYRHKDDPASHAHKKITERNKVMFGTVGTAYVYFTYGMHYCFNVVARDASSDAGAVLIRAIHPESGIKAMQRNRGMSGMSGLVNGPAKLAQALQITKVQYGADLTTDPNLHITDGSYLGNITASPRVGIRKAADRQWNFRIEI